MNITTPHAIADIAWEGELVAAANTYGPKPPAPLVARIGQPEIWPAAEALENEVGKKWVAPLGGASYWLIRLACTLFNPSGLQAIGEAQQSLTLRPQSRQAPERAAYAFSLFPERLGAEDKAEFSVGLGPELTFGPDSSVKLGEIGAKIEYRKVYPVIQSYGAGGPEPHWVFKPHRTRPLDGDQFVYAVVVAEPAAQGIQAMVELRVVIETQFGPVRLAPPEESRGRRRFTIP